MAYSSQQKYAIAHNTLSPAEKELIKIYEIQWMLGNTVPTIEEVYEFVRKKYPRTRLTSINYYLNRAPVQAALNKRGIPYLQHTQEDLTATQIAVANVMMNFTDTRSNYDKLDSMGVNLTQYDAWLKDPQFNALIKALADQNLKNVDPVAVTELTKKISGGEWPAIKFYLETTGRLINQNAPQAEVMLMKFVEVIQMHVKDPKIIMAIAKDLKLVAANKTLEAVVPRQITITGEVDEELEKARRMVM
jgi:Helix-turn-helix of insertion element transposase